MFVGEPGFTLCFYLNFIWDKIFIRSESDLPRAVPCRLNLCFLITITLLSTGSLEMNVCILKQKVLRSFFLHF